MYTLNGKNALIGGGSDGIGLASAQALARTGANITLVARNEERLQTALATLDISQNQQHDFLVLDFAQPAQVENDLSAYLGKNNPTFHILVNNSGGPAAGAAHTAALDAFAAAFAQHLLSAQVLLKALLPNMRASGYGRIINIISTSVKQPLPNLGVSNTIRGAVASWAKTLSLELAADGITVNNVLPGATNTARLQTLIEQKSKKTGASIESVTEEMLAEIPARRFAEPQEIAAAVAFLASPAAAYINGINLPVDGGRTRSL